MRRCLYIWFFLLYLPVFGQDIIFNLPLNQPVTFNPAISGFCNDNLLSISNRDQWRSNSKAISTNAISYNKYLPWQIKKESPLVLNGLILSDNYSNGTFVRNNVLISITDKIKINEDITLGTSLYFGIVQHSINSNKYKWGTQYDGFKYDSQLNSLEDYSKESFFNFDCGFGFIANYRGGYTNYYEKKIRASIGFALYHLNNPRYSLDNRTDLYARKTYFANIGGRIFNNFRWMYLIMVNKQGPNLLALTGGEIRYLFNESNKIKSIGYEAYTCQNKTYFFNKIQTGYVNFNLFIDFSQLYVGISYGSYMSPTFTGNLFSSKITEISLKYKFLKNDK